MSERSRSDEIKKCRGSVVKNRFKSYVIFSFDNFTRAVQSSVTKRRYHLCYCSYRLNCDSLRQRFNFEVEPYKSAFHWPESNRTDENVHCWQNRQFKWVYGEFHLEIFAFNESFDGRRWLIKISVQRSLLSTWMLVRRTWMFRSMRKTATDRKLYINEPNVPLFSRRC